MKGGSYTLTGCCEGPEQKPASSLSSFPAGRQCRLTTPLSSPWLDTHGHKDSAGVGVGGTPDGAGRSQSGAGARARAEPEVGRLGGGARVKAEPGVGGGRAGGGARAWPGAGPGGLGGGAGAARSRVYTGPRGVRALSPAASRSPELPTPAATARPAAQRAARHVELPAQRHGRRRPTALPARPAGAVRAVAALPAGRRPPRPGLQRAAAAGQPARPGRHDHARRLLRQHGGGGAAALRPGARASAGPWRSRRGHLGPGQRGARLAAGAVQCGGAGDTLLHCPVGPGLLYRARAATHLYVQCLQHPARVRLRLGRRPARRLLLPALLHLQPRGREAGGVLADAGRGGGRRHHAARRLPGARPGRALRACAPGAGPQGGHTTRPGRGPPGPLGAQAAGGHRVRAVRALDAPLPDAPGAHGLGSAGEATGRAPRGDAASRQGPVQVPGLRQQRCGAAFVPPPRQKLPRQAPETDEEAAPWAPELFPGPSGGAAGDGIDPAGSQPVTA